MTALPLCLPFYVFFPSPLLVEVEEGVLVEGCVLVPLILRWQPGGGERPGVTASFTVRGVWVSLSLLSAPCWRPLTTPYPPQGLPDTSHFPVASPAGGL